MSNKVIGYDNALWRVVNEFTYTGQDQPFTLQPGEYLFICEGAHGGKGIRNQREYGAITFGEITLNEQTTFHAVVVPEPGLYVTSQVGGLSSHLAYKFRFVVTPQTSKNHS